MKRAGILRPWAVFVWLLVWQIGAMALDQQILLVSPIQVLARLGELALQAEFWKAVGFSMLRITGGFLLGAAVGTVLAALSARLRLVEELLAPLLLAIKSIPVASFIILSLILFSSRNLSILISFLMVLPVLYSGVLGGIRAMDRQMLEMAQLFRIPTLRRIRYVYLPQVMPYFQAACASALGLLEVGNRCRGHRYANRLYRRAASAGQGLSGHAGSVCLDTGHCTGKPVIRAVLFGSAETGCAPLGEDVSYAGYCDAQVV